MTDVYSPTARVLFTPQGAVLKLLREKSDLSMTEAGEKIGAICKRKKSFSATYISQIENHRVSPPKGENLLAFLKVYKTDEKYFQKLCREWKNKVDDSEIIKLALPKLTTEDKRFIRQWIEGKLSKMF